jgi:SAM-dependent methyltransferase
MKKIYTTLHINNSVIKKNNLVYSSFLSVGYWLSALLKSAPGLLFHAYISLLGLRMLTGPLINKSLIYSLIYFPMDSFRYFEFDFFWSALSNNKNLGNYLDISSPRLFSIRVLNKLNYKKAIIINPDANDLLVTKQLITAFDLSNRCELRNCVLNDLNEHPSTLDTIVSISVIEHIPDGYDRDAIIKIWSLLRPGGRLLLSVPCAREAFEEYLDFNEYGLLGTDENNFVLGQRFYDQDLLEKQIFDITGNPLRFAVYGEKSLGSFNNNRAKKLSGVQYPQWREPWMMAEEYRYFNSISELPGWGVIAMEFVKS